MTDRAARFAAAYAALWAAHDLADHVVQTDEQARTKGQPSHRSIAPGEDVPLPWWPAMAGHVGSYHLVQLAAVAMLRRLGVRPRWWRILLATAWSAATHTVLDRRWPVLRLLEATGSGAFARSARLPARTVPVIYGEGLPHVHLSEAPLPFHGPHLADQALHHTAIAVTAAILAGGAR